MTKRAPTELMLKHWTFQREVGRPCKPIYALVSLGITEQPKGYVKGWALRRAHMAKRQQDEWQPDAWTIERYDPD